MLAYLVHLRCEIVAPKTTHQQIRSGAQNLDHASENGKSRDLQVFKELLHLVKGALGVSESVERTCEWRQTGITENELVEAAAVHNVVPLLGQAVEGGEIDLSTESRNWIHAVRHATRAHARFFVDELICILGRFAEQSIPVLCYKGPVMGQLVYSQPGLRPCRDLDLLVPPDQVDRTREVLREDGYRCVPENKWRQSIEFFFKRQYHYSKGEFTFAVDVHTRPVTVEHTFNVCVDELLGRSQDISIYGKPIPTLDAVDHLILACYHGGKEGWSRLSRIVDVAGLLAHDPGLDFHRLSDRIHELRVGRVVKLGLFLAHELFDTPVQAPLRSHIQNPDPAMRRLASDLMNQLVYGETVPRGGAFLNQCRYLFRLHETVGARLRALSMTTANRALLPVLRRLS